VSKTPTHRPFRVLGARKQNRRTDHPEQAKAPPAAPLTFAEAAARTGVKPLTHRPQRIRRAAGSKPVPAPSSDRTPEFSILRDDDWLKGYRSDLGPSALRRLRVGPSATLDLHGATVERARRTLVAFLAAERARGRKVVLVIVGKGRHSPGGRSVLRDAAVEWLTTAAAARDVLAFATAPPEWGGSGGVLVLLAGDRKG
jgi:DNA-nicking Smr family endonuclease